MAAEILNDAGTDATFAESEAVETICAAWLEYALQYCNRTDFPSALVFAVKDAAAAAYQKRGDEGAKSVSVGGQSVAYEELHTILHQRLADAGLRILRL